MVESGNNIKRIIGQLLSIGGTLIMVAAIAVCLALMIPKLAGYSSYVVVSGSMEPNIPVGSLALSKKVDPATLETGDVIVFVNPARGTTPITHRVVSNDTANGKIVTKGDANESEDVNPATYENVVGKVEVHVPYAGSLASMLTSALGKITAAMVFIEAWLLIEIGRRLKAEA